METKQERLKSELRKLGLVAKETDEKDWLSFTYSDLTFRCNVNEDYMAIGVCFYQEHDVVDRDKILEVINRVNDRINFAKVIEIGDVFWLTYEVDVETRMPGSDEIKKMIMLLTGDYYHLVSVYEKVVGLTVPGGEEDIETESSFDWDGFVNKEDEGKRDDYNR